MRVRKAVGLEAEPTPETRSDLHRWVRERLPLSTSHEQALIEAIDSVFVQHEHLWQQSKQEAIQAVSVGFTERLNRLRDELSARDATVSSITRYFEEGRSRRTHNATLPQKSARPGRLDSTPVSYRLVV